MPRPEPIILTITEGGQPTARTIADLLGAEIHSPGSGVTDHIRALFAAGVPLVGVCAAGILIRALGPVLSDKWAEPPVIAVAEDGSSVVPLLGGHHGANALACRIAGALGGTAAITTAGDLA
ncbi:MAG: precorrin-3B C(17)-methyltransferase, partial [Pseudomonadota bacterium]